MAQSGLQQHFSFQSFLRGMIVVTALYALLAGYVFFKAEHTMRELSSQLSFDAVPLKKSEPVLVNEEQKSEVNKNGLMMAPIEGLYEKSEKTGGLLPKISPRGLTPFHGYKKPFTKGTKPVIALAISNFGLSQQDSDKMLETMPQGVTFILTPYASDIQSWQQKARDAGHETWLFVPAENARATIADPGSQALLSHSNIQYNQDRLDWALSLTTGYAGIAMDMDNTFLEVRPMLGALMDQIFKRGLGYYEMNTRGPDAIEASAIENNSPYLKNSVAGYEKLFDNLEIAAQGRGSVSAVIRLDQLNQEDFIKWVASLEGKGFDLAPLSALAGSQ